jgi:hypothetical protein
VSTIQKDYWYNMLFKSFNNTRGKIPTFSVPSWPFRHVVDFDLVIVREITGQFISSLTA